MYLDFAKILMISTLSELKIIKVKNKFSKFFIQVHLVYSFKNQYFISLNRKKGKKRELNFIKQHNIIVLSKNVKQASQSKLAGWLFLLPFLKLKLFKEENFYVVRNQF